MSLNVQVHGQGIEITPYLQAYAQKKLNLIDKHYNKIVSCKVTLRKPKGNEHYISADLHLAPRKRIHAEVHLGDMYAAIDKLADILSQAVKKHHFKRISRGYPRKRELL